MCAYEKNTCTMDPCIFNTPDLKQFRLGTESSINFIPGPGTKFGPQKTQRVKTQAKTDHRGQASGKRQ